ncbi:GNAT family N-acetyltransferase [Actinosynnema sp. NPDC020468]|uniref:GNAT family N-acetyltransferase n=1 Tax=Actinosynnema sp. NPDC020468 TaxID=3154488 RepID=UPI0034075675
MVELRVLDVDEWNLWRDLRLAALEESPDAFGATYASWVDADEGRWRKRLAKPSFNVVALLEGEYAGMVSGLPGEERVDLMSLWVAPFARGIGVGDALVRRVVEWAAPKPVALRVNAGQEHANALYLRNGFVEVADGLLVKVPG